MKVQCSCGAQYEFEVTPELAQGPVQFTCPACQGDLSEALTNLFRQELAQGAIPVASPVQSPQLAARGPLRVQLHTVEASPAESAVEQPIEPAIEEPRCPRHPAE